MEIVVIWPGDQIAKCALFSQVLDQYVPHRNHYYILNKAAHKLFYKYLLYIHNYAKTLKQIAIIQCVP